jgi:hypothetical protein
VVCTDRVKNNTLAAAQFSGKWLNKFAWIDSLAVATLFPWERVVSSVSEKPYIATHLAATLRLKRTASRKQLRCTASNRKALQSRRNRRTLSVLI